MSTILIRENGETLEFDATITINFAQQNTITEHPLETGATVADHVQRQPDTVTITGVVSDSPLGNSEDYHVQDALRFLNDVGTSGELLELDSRHGLTGNWALESWPYDVTQLQSLTFSITLKQVSFSETKIVILPREIPKPVVADVAPPEVDAGRQPTEFVGPVQEEGLKSKLAGLVDFTKNIVSGE